MADKVSVAIHQPNFLPWFGYFYKIAHSDIFVFLDNVAYTKNSFQNRNRIKTAQGALWLTCSVRTAGKFGQMTNQVEFLNEVDWKAKHLRTLEINYRRAPNYKDIMCLLRSVYERDINMMAEFNIALICKAMEYLQIQTKCNVASNMLVSGKASNLLVDICKKVGANRYLSGKGGLNYQDGDLFESSGIELEYLQFSHPRYPQLWEGFLENMSIVDALFNCSRDELRKMLC